ncbi:MAG: hypothetical protein R3F65_27570 [bacterium]
MARHAWLVLASMAWLTCLPSMASAQSPTETCVEVDTTRPDREGIRRLVMTEIDRFRTHRSAEKDCGSFLRVEIIDLAGKSYVTGRINTQVPHREPVDGGDLAQAIERMLRVVLHNDPVRLRGPRSEGFIRRGLDALKHGETFYGAEVYETLAPLDGGFSALPGVAIQLRREATDWHLGARVAFAARLADPPAGQLTLTGRLGVGVQVMYFTDALADSSWYIGGELGVDHQRFTGPATAYADGTDEDFAATTFAVGLRTGFELFRTTTGRLDLFLQATVPVTPSTDDEGGVVDAWTPGLSAGAGLLF